MSRGIGLIQHNILKKIESEVCKSTTLETLRWTLWDGTPSPTGKLPQTCNSSISRAVESLVERRYLVEDSRPLASLEEWVTHYPNKSLYIQTRNLRKELLPHLADWLRDTEGPGARYSKAENESFAASNLSTEGTDFIQSLWADLEPFLRKYYGKTGKENAFLLLVRGKQLFTPWPPFSTSVSFGDLVIRCNSDADIPEELKTRLELIMAQFLPGTSAKALEFKSYMRGVANHIPTNGHCKLSNAAIDALYRRCPDQLSGLPGFKAVAELKRNTRYLISVPDRPEHSPLLEKILDHSVFKKFRFLTVC